MNNIANSYLNVENINKSFGPTQVLNNINFSVKQGEFISLLGPSGCGKTTLLRAIAGLETPCSGSIIQDNKDVTHLPVTQRDFGIVFQSYALFPNLTITENVAYGLKSSKLYSKSEIKENVAELLAKMRLEEHATKYPAQLSGGQQQRVALARALALKPNLLLLDEPLSALDANVRVHLRAEIKKLQKELGITTIMVTHDQEEAMAMADRIVVMDQGVVAQIGTAQEIYHRPQAPFIANFVGKMNFFDASSNESELSINDYSIGYALEEENKNKDLQVAIRPEQIKLLESKTETSVSVVLKNIEFLGNYVRVSVYCELLASSFYVDISSHASIELELDNNYDVELPSKHFILYNKG